jgi:proteasome lid subunit RPN8/RPN11
MILSDLVKDKALQHAKEEDPREYYYRCKNIAPDGDNYFILDPDDYAVAEDKGEITAIIHSHPATAPSPSPADLVACEKSGLPWHVVNPHTETWGYCEPSGYELPYVGRPFFYGVIDCYSLIRDFYKREFNIELTDYNRKDRWWERGESMYLDHFKDEGFREIPLEEIEYGSVILMHLEADVPNHGGIYFNDNMILHHVQDRLSSRDLYGGYYQKNTAKVLKHESR